MESIDEKPALGTGKGKKMSKAKIIFLSIIGIIVIGIASTYIYYINLDVYSQAENGDITSKNGDVYYYNGELTSSYMGGELKTEGMIGRFKGNDFFTTIAFGPEVLKLKDYDAKETFAVDGLMRQEVYTRVK